MVIRNGFTPLHVAAYGNNLVAAGVLLEAGADLHATDSPANGRTPLHEVARDGGGSPKVAELLLRKGADPNATDADGLTPLHFAAQYGSGELVRVLLDWHANPRARDNGGRTPLQYAAVNGHGEVADMIRRWGK